MNLLDAVERSGTPTWNAAVILRHRVRGRKEADQKEDSATEEETQHS